MTAEPDLLPLPPATGNQIVLRGDDFQGDYNFYTSAFTTDQLQAYARANVAHATAARDAEVEALRAEVALLRVGAENERLHHRGLLDRERERAERLAGALRAFVGAAYHVCRTIDPRGYRWSEAYLDQALAEARAALDQETTNG